MNAQAEKRPAALKALLAVLIFEGLSGVLGGVGLVGAPDGSALGMPLSLIGGGPFPDYLVPGLILLLVIGVFPLVTAAGVWRERRWAWWSSLAVGVAVIGWIVGEILILGWQGPVAVAMWVVWGLPGPLILLLATRPTVVARLSR